MNIKFTLIALCAVHFCSATAFGFVSAGYRGGAHSGAPSTGAIVTVRPVDRIGFSFSYNYASIKIPDHVEKRADAYNVITGNSDLDVSKAHIKRYAKELQLRLYPMGGSFFFAVGALSMDGTAHLQASNKSGTDRTEKKYKFSGMFNSLSIGNIWEPGNFMVGAEWAGITRRITYKKEQTDSLATASGANVLDAERVFENSIDDYCGEGSVSALILHIGLSI